MPKFKGEHIYLRALEPEDIDFLYQVENDESLWYLSNTIQPFSRYILTEYLKNAHQDIFEAKQLRLVICANDDKRLGLIDLYDFDPINKRVGLGIVIHSDQDKRKGFGKEAIQLMSNYVFNTLQLHQIYVGITEENQASLHLFKSLNFMHTGTKTDWIKTHSEYSNELHFQLINTNN